MNLRVIFVTMLLGLPALASSSEAWGPDLIEFDLEGGTKIQTMLWMSGFSYSSTELLQSVGCLEKSGHVGSKELIVALNKAFKGKKINSEAATVELGRYLRSNYACVAYNKKLQPIDDAPVE